MSLSSNRHLVWDLFGWTVLAASLVLVANRFEDIARWTAEKAHETAPAGATGAPGNSPDGPAAAANQNGVELKPDRAGQYHTWIEVNGTRVAAMVDTGASVVALTYEDAMRAGYFLHERDFTIGMSTANGIARAAPVTLDRVEIGNIVVRNVPAVVAQAGALSSGNLLGMSFLKRLQRFEVRSGQLVLQD